MALMDAEKLYDQARSRGEAIPLMTTTDLQQAASVVAAAERCGAPLALGLPPVGEPLHEPVAAALEVMAERASVPIILHQQGVETEGAAMLAINRGATSLGLAAGLSEGEREAVQQAAQASSVAVLTAEDSPLRPVDTAAGSEEGLDELLAQGGDWRAWEAVLHRDEWRRRPVDHVILFNVEGLDEGGVAAMLAEGARVLGEIPGVRDLAAGVSIKPDAAYQYHWMVRFAHEGVVPYYRDHPAHVAFADGHFRPVAGNRVSIDYRHWARARGGRVLE